jgi:hypothetical protein
MSTSNLVNSGITDTIRLCHLFLSSRILPNKPNLFFRKYVVAIMTTTCHYPLFSSVNHIILAIAKKQVMRVYTAFSVALMKHHHSLWNWAIVHFPRQPMDGDMLGMVFHNTPISPSVSTYPQKTSRIWFRDYVAFKSTLEGLSGILTSRHVKPPCRVDVFRVWEKVTLLSRPFQYYITKKVNTI